MHPQLTSLQWHGISRPIGSYGALLALALLVGALLALREGERAGLEQGALISSLAAAVACGFVGAFACSVGVRFLLLGSLRAALAVPGIVFYGALLCGGVGLWGAARVFGLPALATLDTMLPALPVAHALGRVGCFFGGCCYGAPSQLPWAVRYPGETIARHPWPLYEVAVLCGLAVLFGKRQPHGKHGHAPGARALGYVLSYAIARFALEPLRGDAVRGVFGACGLSTSQLISLAVVVSVGVLWLCRRRVVLVAAR